MGNPNPSPATRWKRGERLPGAGRPKGTPNVATIHKAIGNFRSLKEVEKDPAYVPYRSATELLWSAMLDPHQPPEVRLACAHSLARSETPEEKPGPFADMTDKEVAELVAGMHMSVEMAARELAAIAADENAQVLLEKLSIAELNGLIRGGYGSRHALPAPPPADAPGDAEILPPVCP